MERNSRKVLRGTVVSDKMDKTIVVAINTKKSHPLYGRQVKFTTKKYYAHDENELANTGDTVTIMACRPISKTKRWRLVSVDKKAVVATTVDEAEATLEAEEGVKEAEAKEGE